MEYVLWLTTAAVIVVLATGQNTVEPQGPGVILDEDKGTVMTPAGYLLQTTEDILFSVFLKIQNPVSMLHPCTQACPESNTESELQLNMVTKDGECRRLRNKVRDNRNDENYIVKMKVKYDGYLGKCALECIRRSNCRFITIEVISQDEVQCVVSETADLQQMENGDSTISEYNMQDECMIMGRSKFCNEMMKRDNASMVLYENNLNYVEQTWQRYESLQQSSYGRQKRSVALLAGAAGLFAMGFSAYEQAKINKHVKQLESKFQKFASAQTKFDEKQIRINNDMLHIMHGIEDRLNEANTLDICYRSNLAFYIVNNRRLQQWSGYLHDIYHGVLFGQRDIGISPILLPEKSLERVMVDNELFADTVYSMNSKLVYKFGKMHIANASKAADGHFNVRVVITIPRIEDSDITTLYQTKQVGIKTADGKCNSFQLPNYVAVNKNTLTVVPESNCNDEMGTVLCRSRKSTNQSVSCITPDTNCQVVLEKCQTSIMETAEGVLIRTDEQVDVSEADSTQMVVQIMPDNGVKFFSFQKYSAIKVGQRLILPQKQAVGELVVRLEKQPAWTLLLAEQANQLHDQTMEQIRQEIDVQDKLLTPLKNTLVRTSIGYFWWIAPAASGFVVMAGGVIICILCRKYFADKNNSNDETEADEPSRPGPSQAEGAEEEAFKLLGEEMAAYKERQPSADSTEYRETRM